MTKGILFIKLKVVGKQPQVVRNSNIACHREPIFVIKYVNEYSEYNWSADLKSA